MNAIAILYLNLAVIFCDKIYDCKTDVVYMQKNKIVFYETTSYPTFLTKDEFYACNTTFILADKKNRLFVVSKLIRYSVDAGLKADNLLTRIITNISNFTFDFGLVYYDIAAFQGFLNFDNAEDNCPLEAASQPFIVTDESQIFLIFSSYEEKHIRNYSCNWNFIAPEGYGFKIVFEKFDVSSTTKLRIQNTTQIIINEKSVKLLHPYYNNDNNIKIFLSKGDPNFITDMELHGYITVIKLNQKKVAQNCSIIIENEYSFVWTSFHNNIGYNNNMYCNFTLHIPSKTEMYVVVGMNALEQGADIVKYYPDRDNVISLIQNLEFILESYYNGSDRHVLWEFESDGSYQLAGLEIGFEPLICICSKNIVNCDNQEYVIMDNIFGYYCGNMNCSFTILPCNSSLILMEIASQNDEPLNDIFKVVSNEKIILEINSENRKQRNFFAYLNSSSVNIFQVLTFPSSVVKQLSFHFKPFDVPQITLHITLSTDITQFFIDTHLNNFALIKQSEDTKSDVIFLYTTNTDAISLYNNESLTYNLIGNQCFVKSNFEYRCKPMNNKIAIYVNDPDQSPFLVLRSQERAKGCIFKESVFVATELSNLVVTAVSNYIDICEILILISKTSIHCMLKIWTTASTENVKIFGKNQIYPLFEFNSTSASKWKPIIIYSDFYIVKLPIGSAIMININVGECDNQ